MGTAAPSPLCVPSMNLRTAYNFPFLAAQVTAAARTNINSVARHGSMTSRHTFLMSVVCTVFNSCKHGCAINSSISSVTERSGNPAKFNFKCISNSWWISPLNSGATTSSNSFSLSNKDRKRGVARTRTTLLLSVKHDSGSVVKNNPAFGYCSRPLHVGRTRLLWHLGILKSPEGVTFCMTKYPLADVNK